MGDGGGRCLACLCGCLGGLGPGLGGDLDCLGRFQRMHTLNEVLIFLASTWSSFPAVLNYSTGASG